MIKRLGARRWRRLHRLAYVAGVAGCVHFLWLAKVGRTDQYWYVATLVLLLGIRLGDAALRAVRRRRERRAAAGAAGGGPGALRGPRGPAKTCGMGPD